MANRHNESAADFKRRVQARTGVPLSKIPRGVLGDLNGGSILAMRGDTYVVTYGYPDFQTAGGTDVWEPRLENFRVVNTARKNPSGGYVRAKIRAHTARKNSSAQQVQYVEFDRGAVGAYFGWRGSGRAYLAPDGSIGRDFREGTEYEIGLWEGPGEGPARILGAAMSVDGLAWRPWNHRFPEKAFGRVGSDSHDYLQAARN